MFDSVFAAASDVELVAAIEDGVRQEAIAGARRLAAIAELTRRRVEDDDERALWVFDPWDSTAAEVGAAMAIGSRRASGQMRIAEALREHLPQVAALYGKGALSTRLVSTITWATRLVQGEQAWADIDAAIAERAVNWERLSEDKLRVAVDAQVARYDPDAQRRTETAVRGRDFIIGACDDDTDIVSVFGQLLGPAAAALKQRVAAMVNGLCADDPRSAGERRSDAAGAIADKNDVLACRCGSPNCPTAGREANVECGDPGDRRPERHHRRHATSTRTATTEEPAAKAKVRPAAPALLLGHGVLPNALLAEAIRNGATIKAIRIPGVEPESRYRPSDELAEFVRMRICSAASPAATSPPIAATSTMPAPGPRAPPMRRT